MCKARPVFLVIIVRHAILAGLITIVAVQAVFAQRTPGAFIDNPANLSCLARKQYFSGQKDESIALYQKAIEKAEQDYGKNSPAVGDLSYEMGVRAYDLCRFDLAERCLKKAVMINPDSLPAQLMLVQLLRFRNQDGEAYRHVDRAVKKHWDASEARRGLMLCLQSVDPASAAQQAFIINCLQNGSINKIPAREVPPVQNQAQTPAANPASKPTTKSVVKNETADATKKSQSETGKEKAVIEAGTKLPGFARKKMSNNAGSKGARNHGKSKERSGKRHKSQQHMPSLLVPPPPLPNWFGFLNPKHEAPQASAQQGLKAKANSIKKEKTKVPANETNIGETKPEVEAPPQHASKHSGAETDSDFLLDWGGIKKKSGKK
jgi:hypothetical protein